ncbi:MAG: hypothetical protein LBF22_04045 [Deltaproteobacteria bacterium]|nr:hypothetical protein [Deltaproteobacteria bacterium]
MVRFKSNHKVSLDKEEGRSGNRARFLNRGKSGIRERSVFTQKIFQTTLRDLRAITPADKIVVNG